MEAGRQALLAVQKAAEEAPSGETIAQRIHRSQSDECATIGRLKKKIENLKEFMPQSVLRTSEIHIPLVDKLCECDASCSSHQKINRTQSLSAQRHNIPCRSNFRRIVLPLMSSRNEKRLQTIQNSLLFQLRKFVGPDFTKDVHETEECMIPVPCIGPTTVEEALAGHYGQSQGGEDIFQSLTNETARILVIHLAKVVRGSQGAFKDCTSLRFENVLSLKRVTCPIDRRSWYQLTGIIAHIGSLNYRRYLSFCLIRRKSWMFNDSAV
jgi:hypothetical protein